MELKIMKDNKEIQIVFEGEDPLINIKTPLEQEIDHIEEELKNYKRINHINYILEGFILGSLFTILINVLIFLLVI